MRTMLRALATVVVATIAGSALAQNTIRCESKDDRYHECRFQGWGTVILERELSISPCTEGETWGVRGNTIWVDKGCRGEFTISKRGAMRRHDRRPPMTIICESYGNRRHYCAAETFGNVELMRQLGSRSCTFGRDWGYDSDGVWVANGCRAEFRIGGGGFGYDEPRPPRMYRNVVRCESFNGRRVYCPADTSAGVQIRRQLTDDRCVFNRDWGFDSGGIWVRNGCRADFSTGR